MSFEKLDQFAKVVSNLKSIKNCNEIVSVCNNSWMHVDELPYLLDDVVSYLEDPMGENDGPLCHETHLESHEIAVPKELFARTLKELKEHLELLREDDDNLTGYLEELIKYLKEIQRNA